MLKNNGEKLLHKIEELRSLYLYCTNKQITKNGLNQKNDKILLTCPQPSHWVTCEGELSSLLGCWMVQAIPSSMRLHYV